MIINNQQITGSFQTDWSNLGVADLRTLCESLLDFTDELIHQ